MARGEIDVELAVAGISDLSSWILSSKRTELRGGCKDQRFVAGFVVTRRVRSGAGLRNDFRAAVEEFDDVGDVEDMLIESGEEENLVALERAADSASDLLLAVVRPEGEKRVGGPERTVAQVVERGAVNVIGARFGDDVDDGASRTALLGAVGVRGYTELLHNFRRELIGRAVASASLGEESVIEVEAIDEKGVLKSANAAEREVAICGGSEAAWILSDTG